MIEMESTFLKNIMPQNLLADENVSNAAAAIDTELQKVSELYIACLLISRIDELPSEIIDILARQWHVDFYDDTLPVETKRKLVKQSIAWHRIKGTKAAVEEVVRAVFNTGIISEWFEYAGQPYHFKIDIIESGALDVEVIRQVTKAIYETKNTRSWLDSLGFLRKISSSIYTAVATASHKSYHIGPPISHDSVVPNGMYWGGTVNIFREVHVV